MVVWWLDITLHIWFNGHRVQNNIYSRYFHGYNKTISYYNLYNYLQGSTWLLFSIYIVYIMVLCSTMKYVSKNMNYVKSKSCRLWSYAKTIGKYKHNNESCNLFHLFFSFLCRLRSIAAHRDHFCPASVYLSVCLSGNHTFLVVTHSYVSQVTHAFLGMLPLCCIFYSFIYLVSIVLTRTMS